MSHSFPPKFENRTLKIIYGTALALSVLILVLVASFAPDAKFNYLFGEEDWSLVFAIVSVLLLCLFVTQFDEKRTSQIYINEDGTVDMLSPRAYTPLHITPISRIIGRENIFRQKNLRMFSYDKGYVYIENSAGKAVEGALKDLTFSYKMNKNKMTDEWYIYQFKVEDNNGNKTQFNRHNALFNDAEYDDITMLLSMCGTIKEHSLSKITKGLDKIVALAEEFDINNISSSTMDMLSDKITDKVMDKAGQLAKTRLMKSGSPKVLSWRKKIIRYGTIALLTIYIIAVVCINISNMFGSSDTYDNILSEESYDRNNDFIEEEDLEAIDYSGTLPDSIDIDGMTEYTCSFEDPQNNDFTLWLLPETGRGGYMAPSGNFYKLEITDENSTRTEFICSAYNEAGDLTKMKFKILISDYGDVSGIMIGTDGQTEYSFKGSEVVYEVY